MAVQCVVLPTTGKVGSTYAVEGPLPQDRLAAGTGPNEK